MTIYEGHEMLDIYQNHNMSKFESSHARGLAVVPRAFDPNFLNKKDCGHILLFDRSIYYLNYNHQRL